MIAMLTIPSAPASAQGKAGVPAAFLTDPLAYFRAGHEDETVRYAVAVADDPGTSSQVRKNALITEGAIHLAQGRFRAAHVAFMRILEQEPAAEIDQPNRVPVPALTLFYQLRDSVCTANMESMAHSGKLEASIRTIAVGDMEDNSVWKGDFDTGHFAKGLVHVLTSDLMSGTTLRVVDRQRLSILREEIGMSHESNLVDPRTRVKFGRLSGAQSFLFGQVMLLDQTHVRMDLRWVDTSTGEVLLAESVDGDISTASDMFKLERKLVLEVLAPRIETYLEKSNQGESVQPSLRRYFDLRRKALPTAKDAYVTAIVRAGQAMDSEDASDYDGAASWWGEVARVDSGDRGARQRADALRTFGQMRSNDPGKGEPTKSDP